MNSIKSAPLKSAPFRIIKLLSAICGSLAAGLPVMAVAPSVSAYPLNPCPQIYYEEPFNSSRAVPAGCPPNAATQELIQRGQVPNQPTGVIPPSNQVTPVTPPLPEQLRSAIASVAPAAGQINLQLRNDTNTIITYQAVGQTEQRVLRGGEEVFLQNLPVPLTVTLVRNDGGFVTVTPFATSDSNVLAISLNETSDLGANQRALRVQEDGQVFSF